MKKIAQTSRVPTALVALLGLVAALVAWPLGAQAQLGGGVVDVTSDVVGGPFVDTVTADNTVELQSGDTSGVGAGFLEPGESIDIGQDTITLVFVEGLQGRFSFNNLDGPQDRDIESLALSGDLSSESRLEFDNGTNFATLTVDCNHLLAPPKQCLGDTLVLTITYAPIGGGDPPLAIEDLKAAVIALDLDNMSENGMVKKLDKAIAKLEQGNTAAAIDNLEGFNGQVMGAQARGDIDEAVGDALIANADDIIALLQA